MRHPLSLIVALVGAFAVVASAQAPAAKPAAPTARDLAAYRAQHPTSLTRHGPPPAMWQDPTPLSRPAGVDEITYESGDLKLKAWMSALPDDGKLHPAVVFCHGGFWFGDEDWTVLKPFLDAGFVVLAPRVRAENGNPGDFSFYFGEVDDAVAAGRFLAKQKGVDPKRLFISGHSAGGALATFAVMVDTPFVLSAPIGASLDMRSLVKMPGKRDQELVVFDPTDAHEVEARTAVLFTASLRAPIVLFRGEQEGNEQSYKNFLTLARYFKKSAEVRVVSGDHFKALPNAIPEIVKLFVAYVPK